MGHIVTGDSDHTAPVRFVEDNIRSPWEGLIEVYYGGQWDRICSARWDIYDANVVCRELGYSGAASAEYSGATHREHTTAILDGVLCIGTESHLLDCPRLIPLSNVTGNCLGSYAGVTCLAGCQNLSPPENGYIVKSTGNGINDTVMVDCFKGFMLSGSVTRNCQMNGEWSGMPTRCTAFNDVTLMQRDDEDSATMTATIVLAVVLGLLLLIILLGAGVFYAKKRLVSSNPKNVDITFTGSQGNAVMINPIFEDNDFQ